MNGKRVLFVSHSAGRTGAPVLLLNFLRWFKDHADIPFQILLREGGPLQPEFQELADTAVYSHLSRRVERTLPQRVLRRLGLAYQADLHFEPLSRICRPSEFSAIYSNTIMNGDLLPALSALGCPIITHVHELDYWINRCGRKNFGSVTKHTTHYIACAEAARRNLVERHAIPAERISVVHEFIPDTTPADLPTRALAIRESLGIPPQASVVGGSGWETWRKGKDLFVELAAQVVRRDCQPSVHFVWVGPHESEEDWYGLQHDIQRARLSERVHFVGEVTNPLDYFAAFDLFALTSREDPFPLVCLEAGLLGKPVLCFDSAGGAPELVEDDAGFVVPYLDIQAMADKITLLASSSELRKRLGDRAAAKVRARHLVSNTAPKILKIIEQFLA